MKKQLEIMRHLFYPGYHFLDKREKLHAPKYQAGTKVKGNIKTQKVFDEMPLTYSFVDSVFDKKPLTCFCFLFPFFVILYGLFLY